jgi:hypothetical protein
MEDVFPQPPAYPAIFAVFSSHCTLNPFVMLLQIEMKDAEVEGDMPTIKLFLWRADAVTGVVDMDKDTIVVKPACCVLHPTGMLFGCSDKTLLRQPMRNFLQLPGKMAESLLADEKQV